MKRYLFCCSNRTTTIAALLLALTVGFSQRAFADEKLCWINAATGTPVPTYPLGWDPLSPDPDHFSSGGKNFVKLPDGTWIDAATGTPVPTYPLGWNALNPDPDHFSSGGKNLVRVPCPPTQMVIKDSGMAQFAAIGVFNGYMLTGSENWSSTGQTKIYQVNGSNRASSIDLPAGLANNRSTEYVDFFGAMLYGPAGAIVTDSAEVWTYDGTTFTNITPSAPAFSTNNGVYSEAAFNNRLFVGTGNSSATAQVWSYDGTNWTEQVIPGFSSGSINNDIWRMKVYNNALYIGTVNYSGAQVWRYDGVHWTKVSIPGFSADNYAIASMAIYNGSLYLGTSNIDTTGAEVWRYDGTGWTKLTGFSKNNSVTSMAEYNGALFIGTTNYGGAAQLWTYDGTSWAQADITGFSSDNSGIVSMAEYNGSLYFGTYNNTGAELWYVTAAGYNPCTATLSSDLSLHIPIVTYSGQAYWADLTNVPGTLNFAVANLGIISDTTPFAGCAATTLSTDLRVHIPSVSFSGMFFWADLTYNLDTQILSESVYGPN